MPKRPTADDVREVISGKGSPRDKAEVTSAGGLVKLKKKFGIGETRSSLKSGSGGQTKRRKVKLH